MNSKMLYVSRRAPPRLESHQCPDVRVLMIIFSGDVPPELVSDGANRSIQYIQQKIGVFLVQAHRRGKTNCLNVQTAFSKQKNQVPTVFQHLGAFIRRWFFRNTVFHKLNSQEQALTAHVTYKI